MRPGEGRRRVAGGGVGVRGSSAALCAGVRGRVGYSLWWPGTALQWSCTSASVRHAVTALGPKLKSVYLPGLSEAKLAFAAQFTRDLVHDGGSLRKNTSRGCMAKVFGSAFSFDSKERFPHLC